VEHRVIDLFSGVGGLSLGAARAGFTVYGAVDTDPHSIMAHKNNFPNTRHLLTSVFELTGETLKMSLGLDNGNVDGIIGGPPCQGFSSIGKRNKDDARNQLFVEFFRIVTEIKPKFYLAENVPGIMKGVNAEIVKKALSYVENAYVVLKPMILVASDYGAPTVRKRAFFVGYLRNAMGALMEEYFKPPAEVVTIFVKDALRGLPTKINPNWQSEEQGWRIVHAYGDGFYSYRLHGQIPPGVGNQVALDRLRIERRASGFLGTVHSRRVADRYARVECGKSDPVSKSYRLDPNGFCPTLRAGTDRDRGSFQAVRPLHPTENRVITIREAARLQGFPDWFQFSPTKWHSFRQIGSSVSPIIAERILQVIRRKLD